MWYICYYNGVRLGAKAIAIPHPAPDRASCPAALAGQRTGTAQGTHMAAHLLKKTRSHQPTFFDTFGYGSRPQRPSSFSTMLVSAAFFFHFGLLPILWNVATSVPSIVWTGASTALHISV